ncbi:ABC transporter ATP-binding protein [Lachnobacterium bovis]|uniref:ABC transporter ATP-binding protein n=1 Tax=Lachnobacterium bovis TaxID=140626 RepID=UPI000485E5E8|nr:ABC transporter ATP-binding protein [Lachnobacterium bovis]
MRKANKNEVPNGSSVEVEDVKYQYAAVWPVCIAIVIVFTSKKVQKYFVKKYVDAKVDLSEAIQEFIESLRDLKSNNAEKIT